MLTLEIINPIVSRYTISIHRSATVGDVRIIIGTSFPLYSGKSAPLSDKSFLLDIYPNCEGRIIIGDDRFDNTHHLPVVRTNDWIRTHLTGYGALPKLLDLIVDRWLPDYITKSNIDRSIKRQLFINYCGGKSTSIGKMIKFMRRMRNDMEHHNKVSFNELGIHSLSKDKEYFLRKSNFVSA